MDNIEKCDEKPTDNEIAKALKYWKQFDKEIDILIKRYPEEKAYLLEQREILKITFGVFDLINRLQAENENYSKNNQQMTSDILAFYKTLETAKAEAYKEFAERLKKEKFKINYCGSVYNVVDVDGIDNLLKELVGEDG